MIDTANPNTVPVRQRKLPIGLLIPAVLAVALIVWLYLSTFQWWWHEWTAPGSFYAHAIFVPFFVVVMVWRNRERLTSQTWKPSWAGVPLVLIAMALLMMAQRSDVTTIKSLSFMFLMFGIVLGTCGTKWTRVLLFPLFFIVMMMPLIPDQLINGIAFPIQMASASIATKLLNLLTLSSQQQGTVIQMETYKMAVELPCSGFKTLVSLLTFSAAFAYLIEGKLWKRWTLFLMTIPLSLMINALRITLIGIVGQLISTAAAKWFHDFSGFIVLIIAFMFLFSFARVLKCDRFLGVPMNDELDKAERLAEAARKERGEALPPTPSILKTLLNGLPDRSQAKRVLPYLTSIVGVLAVALLVRTVAVKPIVPLPPIATMQVPKEFTTAGVTYKLIPDRETDKLTKAVQEALNPARVINRFYTGSDGSQIQLFITAGNGRKVFHDPHTCSLGSDAVLQDVGTADVPTSDGKITLQESHYHYNSSPNNKFVMMFGYVVDDKVVQRTEQVRNSMILQTFFGDSGKPSYFVRVMQMTPGENQKQREQVTNFVSGLWQNIGPVLLGKAAAIDEPPPVPSDISQAAETAENQ